MARQKAIMSKGKNHDKKVNHFLKNKIKMKAFEPQPKD